MSTLDVNFEISVVISLAVLFSVMSFGDLGGDAGNMVYSIFGAICWYSAGMIWLFLATSGLIIISWLFGGLGMVMTLYTFMDAMELFKRGATGKAT